MPPIQEFTLYYTVLYYTVLHCTVLHCTALYCTTLYCTTLYCSVLYCTVLHCTTLHCTVLHCTTTHFTALPVHAVRLCPWTLHIPCSLALVLFTSPPYSALVCRWEVECRVCPDVPWGIVAAGIVLLLLLLLYFNVETGIIFVARCGAGLPKAATFCLK
jgi:hypothetical protein